MQPNTAINTTTMTVTPAPIPAAAPGLKPPPALPGEPLSLSFWIVLVLVIMLVAADRTCPPSVRVNIASVVIVAGRKILPDLLLLADANAEPLLLLPTSPGELLVLVATCRGVGRVGDEGEQGALGPEVAVLALELVVDARGDDLGRGRGSRSGMRRAG